VLAVICEGKAFKEQLFFLYSQKQYGSSSRSEKLLLKEVWNVDGITTIIEKSTSGFHFFCFIIALRSGSHSDKSQTMSNIIGLILVFSVFASYPKSCWSLRHAGISV
jgi:hypothetical protein